MKNVSIALLGCGTVGKGVVDLLTMNGPLIEEQLNTKINIKRVLIRDLNKYEKMEDLPDSIQLTTDFNDIINDDEIDIVVEVMGSADFAKDCIEQCFLRGKSVISANKDLIADYGIPLLKLSQQHNVDFRSQCRRRHPHRAPDVFVAQQQPHRRNHRHHERHDELHLVQHDRLWLVV